jgi:hypothetical protein
VLFITDNICSSSVYVVEADSFKEYLMQRRIVLSLVVAIVLVYLAIPFALAADVQSLPSESWLGVYIAGQKTGYMHMVTEKAQYEGRECLKISSFLRMKMVLLGQNAQQDVKTVTYTDERYTPLFQTYDMSSGGSKTVIEAKFLPKEVQCKVISKDVESQRVVPIPEGKSLIGDSMYALGSGKMAVGQKTNTYFFNPMTISIDPLTAEVLRQENIEVKGKTYDTYVVKCSMGNMGDVTTWQTESGNIIKSVAILGLTMLKETGEEAVSGVDSDYIPPDDLAVLSSVKANIDIPDPRAIKKLIIKLSGNLEPKMGISDNRQKVRWLENSGEDKVGEWTIDAEKFDPAKSAKLPIKDKALDSYLKPSPYLQCDAPEIKAKAAEIVSNEKSAYKAAERIRSWVSANMKPQADIGIARPAIDVLKNKVGVCRDYAVLFASLARAAGIPTKIDAGLIYMNGHFYYHAWVEAYVGEWVVFDATLKSDFVDATHIKLTEGDATNMFEMASVFGTLKAEIVKFQ